MKIQEFFNDRRFLQILIVGSIGSITMEEKQYTMNTLGSDTKQDYLNEIIASEKYFVSTANKADSLTKVNRRQRLNQRLNTQSSEPMHCSKINYVAILTLEKLGLDAPSQEQIDTVETLILFAMKTKHLANKTQLVSS